MTDQPLTPEEQAHEQFWRDTVNHRLTVLHDDGLYRHLKLAAPGTNIYRFDLITWPGYLAITGDVETHVFSRLDNMFSFFLSSEPGINPDYWTQKLQAADARSGSSVHVFSPELYRQRVEQWLVDEGEDLPNEEVTSLTAAVNATLLDTIEPPYDQRDAIVKLQEFEHRGHVIPEPYEWTLTEFSGHYLWCCWAILWGIQQYRAAKGTVSVD